MADTLPDATGDVRPIVGRDTGNRPLWIGLAAILIVALLLFASLDARRRAKTAPAVRPLAADVASMPSTVAPLYVPPEPVEVPLTAPIVASAPSLPIAPIAPMVSRALSPLSESTPLVVPFAITTPELPSAIPTTSNSGATLVFDTSGADGEAGSSAAPATSTSLGTKTAAITTRARAAFSMNRSTVVPQGTLIAAVLETALDSTQSGQARALVSRDVANQYGDHVLIPRGSKLFGDYHGELAAGQHRAQVQWLRLIRPDGVTIAIDSPAADRLGRAGVRGHVDNHFLARLGSALLQSTIDIGTSVASRSLGSGTVVVALPGSVSSATSQLIGSPPKPTLTVRQGTQIAVFVARDLDFTSVEARR